jgi:hypothetical protein
VVIVIKKLNIVTLFLLFLTPIFCQAASNAIFNRSLYMGGIGGIGSTTWQGLVPSKDHQNFAINMSTPIKVREGGNAWGLMGGYEISPYFALEASYAHYPTAKIGFDAISLFSFDNEGLEQFDSETETYSLAAKVMLIIPNSNFRVFSSAGVTKLHRQDIIMDDWRLTPNFGVGVNYHLSEHLMAELNGNYTAGFGESQLNPTDTYFPFLYSLTFRLAYFF